jgi:hypothetical protein
MKAFPLFLFIFFFPASSFAWFPNSNWHWGDVICKVDKKDSAFLIDTEKKMLKLAITADQQHTKGPHVFTDSDFRSSVYDWEFTLMAEKPFPRKEAHRFFDLRILWNVAADSCFIMSFSSVEIEKYCINPYVPASKKKYTTDTSAVFRIPLSEYPSYLNAEDMQRLNTIVLKQFAKAFSGEMRQDTLFRHPQFDVDKNNTFPQATMEAMTLFLSEGLYYGELRGAKNNTLSSWYDKEEGGDRISGWDSTNEVEDPTHPGTFINAPLKGFQKARWITLNEMWIPFTADSVPTYARPYLCLQRKLSSLAINYENKATVWFDAAEMYAYISKQHFRFSLYEEIFRAERYRKMGIYIW